MKEKKEPINSISGTANPLLAVRQREEQLDAALAETVAQAQAIRQEADQEAHAIEEATRRPPAELATERKQTLSAQTQQVESAAAQQIAESLRQVALLAGKNMEEAVQLLAREVLPAE